MIPMPLWGGLCQACSLRRLETEDLGPLWTDCWTPQPGSSSPGSHSHAPTFINQQDRSSMLSPWRQQEDTHKTHKFHKVKAANHTATSELFCYSEQVG